MGITIAADNVTIDMMGFSLIGVPSAGSGITIAEGAFRRNMTIRNGKITDWGKSGVHLTADISAQSFNAIVEGVQASENGEYGFEIGGNGLLKLCPDYEHAFWHHRRKWNGGKLCQFAERKSRYRIRRPRQGLYGNRERRRRNLRNSRRRGHTVCRVGQCGYRHQNRTGFYDLRVQRLT